jgi:hypothetical protein
MTSDEPPAEQEMQIKKTNDGQFKPPACQTQKAIRATAILIYTLEKSEPDLKFDRRWLGAALPRVGASWHPTGKCARRWIDIQSLQSRSRLGFVF